MLTKGGIGGNMWKSQRESGERKWYNLSLERHLKKVFKKTWKKVLTNEESCSIIAKHLRETSESESIEGVKNRTLKIKQRRDKKEPDKTQKSFICTRILKIQTVIAN